MTFCGALRRKCAADSDARLNIPLALHRIRRNRRSLCGASGGENHLSLALTPPESKPVKKPIVPCLLALAALLPFAGCTQHSGPAAAASAPAKRSASLPPAPGSTATVSEADTGRTVRIGLGETVAIRLAVDESTGNHWFMSNRLGGGVLVKKGNAVYTQTPGGTVATLLYQGLRPGTQELHFSFAPAAGSQNVARTADFRVIVR